MEGDAFQNNTSTINPRAWFMGENNRKKSPGLTVLKYSLAVAMELGMSHPHDLASINDVNKLVNSKPLARLIETNKVIFFMIFFYKDDIHMMQKIVFNGHSHKYVPSHNSCLLCIHPVSDSCTS